MAGMFSGVQAFGALARREFWTFKAYHALAGALLTVFGAGEAIFVNEGIRRDITLIDRQVAGTADRLATIDRVLFQFRFAQTNAITLGVLSANDSLKPEFRKNMVDLMFVTRRLPTEMMLQQIYSDDLAGFDREKAKYEGLVAAAQGATSQADWDAVNGYEFARESELFNVEQRLFSQRDSLLQQRSREDARLSFAVTLGFALQQMGFVIVLLAGLVHRHRETAPVAPAQEAAAH